MNPYDPWNQKRGGILTMSRSKRFSMSKKCGRGTGELYRCSGVSYNLVIYQDMAWVVLKVKILVK